MDDVRAVMDAAGMERAALLGAHEGSRLAILFAATYPERTAALVLFDPSPKGRRSADYPWARSDEEWRDWLREVGEGWGTPEFFARQLLEYTPTRADDEEFRAWYVRHMRQSASPGAAVAFQRMVMDGDVTDVLPAIRVPTLVLHRAASAGPAAYVPSASPTPSAATCRGSSTASPGRTRSGTACSWTRPRRSCATSTPRPSPSACWPRSSSPTSSARRSGRRSWATRAGASSSAGTTSSCAESSSSTAGSS